MTRLLATTKLLTLPFALGLSAASFADCGTEPVGRLVQDIPNGPLRYVTANGAWTIEIDQHTITVADSANLFEMQTWGDPHENLGGKHIKDWQGKRRSLLLSGGAKVTMNADGPHGVTLTTSIYDGVESHQINNSQNAVDHSCDEEAEALARDAAEYDGETSHLAVLPRAGEGVTTVFFENVYNQAAPDEDGTPAEKTLLLQPLGEAWPLRSAPGGGTQVHDFYDDPRIGAT